MAKHRYMESTSNALYSLIVRKGPDIAHYDVVALDDGIHFIYLGEHWEVFRPRTGLQKRMDLLVYALRKKRRRQTNIRSGEDFVLNYCDVRGVELQKDLDRGTGRLIIFIKGGGRVEAEYPLKIHEVVKEFIKTVRRYILKKCGEESPIS